MATNVTGIDCSYSSSIVEIPFSEKAGVKEGNAVIFKDAEGKEEYGVVRYVKKETADLDNVLFDSRVLRIATPNDVQRLESHVEQAEDVLATCKKIVKKLDITMYVFKAAYSFDGTKIYFMFTADERVDFRDLVKELAAKLKKQIHLRQIGPRDKAKLVGGYGRCGRRLCCNTFLSKLESINMEMVRDQGLESKGSSKLSGACGKLLCCLKYEVESYRELKEPLPAIGKIVRLKKKVSAPDKEGRVIAVDILNQKLRILFKGDEIAVFSLSDLDI
ncbi:MAG: regulatory iron-sulfur-containing complex subunit RicT [Candidatus Peregrinibacteria bacterium]